MTVNIAYHANDPGVGLNPHKDPERYKLFLADTGLFVTLAFKDKAFADNVIYEKLLSDKLSALHQRCGKGSKPEVLPNLHDTVPIGFCLQPL